MAKRRIISKFEGRVIELMAQSAMRIAVYPRDAQPRVRWMRIDVIGPCAKFPSVSNSRVVNTSKGRVLEKIKTSPNLTRADVFKQVQGMKPRSIADPEAQAVLESLTRMYVARTSRLRSKPTMSDASDTRAFCLVLLADACERMDTHNIPKGICDWLQKLGLVNNDKNVDAIALLKKNWVEQPLDRSCSSIYVVSDDSIKAQLQSFLGRTVMTTPPEAMAL